MEGLVVDQLFWKDKTVFITGHTGFKGAWLCQLLTVLGAKVVGYSIGLPTKPSLFELSGLEEKMISIEGDVRDQAKLQQCLSGHDPEIIIHMAAQSLVRYSYDNPLETYSTNVLGTVNLLEAVRQLRKKRVVINVKRFGGSFFCCPVCVFSRL